MYGHSLCIQRIFTLVPKCVFSPVKGSKMKIKKITWWPKFFFHWPAVTNLFIFFSFFSPCFFFRRLKQMQINAITCFFPNKTLTNLSDCLHSELLPTVNGVFFCHSVLKNFGPVFVDIPPIPGPSPLWRTDLHPIQNESRRLVLYIYWKPTIVCLTIIPRTSFFFVGGGGGC